MTTKSEELSAKADQFATRAAHAKDRKVRNTFRSLEPKSSASTSSATSA